MKTFRVYAKETIHYYIDIEANSDEEAYDKALEFETADWKVNEEANYYNDTWDTYDCEEV